MAKDVLRLSRRSSACSVQGRCSIFQSDPSSFAGSTITGNMRGPNAFKPIQEPRLIDHLRERLMADGRWPTGRLLSLRTPPVGNNDPRTPSPSIQVRVFPTWFTADAPTPEDARRRRMIRWSELDPAQRREWIDDGGKRHPVTPIPSSFAAAKMDTSSGHRIGNG